MAADHLDLGARGEELAGKYLRRAGYRLLARNFRCRFGEIDLVAEEGDNLVFVEVKTRSSVDFGHPLEAVDLRKQGQLIRAAHVYLREQAAEERFCRFDVVAVTFGGKGAPEIELIKNAFELTEGQK
jgi:putative endonuclease